MNKNNKSKPLVIIQCYEDRQPSFPLRKLDSSVSGDRNQEPRPVTNGHSQPTRDASDSPPPPAPPPMPAATNGHSGQNGDLKKRISEIQDKINTDTVNGSRNGSISRTPTPDYNKAETPPHKPKSFPKDDKVELDSLESYKLRSPSSVHPRPPSNYFMQAPNGTATMKKHVRPVSVTIGEYSSGAGGRREPSKLGFLNGDKPDGPQTAGDMPIANRLQSELALTLSRSNLRKKTEALVEGNRT